MEENRQNPWKIFREYKNLYSVEEILRAMIRKHMEANIRKSREGE